jgi:hypothetical protein
LVVEKLKRPFSICSIALRAEHALKNLKRGIDGGVVGGDGG